MNRLLCFLWHAICQLPAVWMIASTCKPVRVESTSGLLEGCEQFVKVQNRLVNEFLGVPYAEQPTGHLRFRRPQMKERSSETVMTKQLGHMCPQSREWLYSVGGNYTLSEECLWLNIYVPDTATPNTTVDVMVFIHGGSYIDGTGNYYDGKILSLVGDMIVVTINYRLGILGFLSSEESYLMGNFGLWDQVMALQWINKNIGQFGGDPKRVTICGNSAGSSSVGILALSPKTKGLFRRIITQSGSPINPWAFVRKPKIHFEGVSQQSECHKKFHLKGASLVDCLRQLPLSEIHNIMAAGHVGVQIPEGSLFWGPWIDNELITFDPKILIEQNSSHGADEVLQFGEYDQLIGVTSQEAAFVYEGKMERHNAEHGLSHNLYKELIIEVSLALVPVEYSRAFESVVRFAYSQNESPVTSTERALLYIKLYSDYAIYTGALQFAKFHARVSQGRGRTFLYRFDYRGSWKSREAWRVGATHEDELPFLFGYGVLYRNGTALEQDYAYYIMTLWSNFIKNGNPNIGEIVNISDEWPEFNIGSEEFIKFSFNKTTNTSTDRKLYSRRHKFWTEFLPEFKESLLPLVEIECVTGGTIPPKLSTALIVAVLFIMIINSGVTTVSCAKTLCDKRDYTSRSTESCNSVRLIHHEKKFFFVKL